MRFRSSWRRAWLALASSVAVAGGVLAAPVTVQAAPVRMPVMGQVVIDKLTDKTPGKLDPGERFSPPLRKSVRGGSVARLLTGPYYHYNLGRDFTNSNPSGPPAGLTANFTIHSKNIDVADGGIHSLTQFAFREVTGMNPATDEQIVEFGYASNVAVFGDNLPRLFGSKWEDSTWCGSWTGSGTCGGAFVDNALNSINLGGSINGAVGNSRQFTVQYDATTPAGGGFWLGYNGSWVGYFPKTGSGWPVNFDQARTVDVYGEMTTNEEPLSVDCTGMGDGLNIGDASPAQGAQVGSVTYLDGSGGGIATTEVDIAVSQFASPGTYPGSPAFNIESESTRTFRYGGPGVC